MSGGNQVPFLLIDNRQGELTRPTCPMDSYDLLAPGMSRRWKR